MTTTRTTTSTTSTATSTARAAGVDGPQPWRALALCAQTDPEAFFPDPQIGENGIAAKRICAECPVQTDCLEWALKTDQRFGVWGGLSTKQRGQLQGRRRRAESPHPHTATHTPTGAPTGTEEDDPR